MYTGRSALLPLAVTAHPHFLSHAGFHLFLYSRWARFGQAKRAVVLIQAFFRMLKPRREYIIKRDEARRLRALEREANRLAGKRTVADVSTVPIPHELMSGLSELSAFEAPYKLEAPPFIEVPATVYKKMVHELPKVPKECWGHEFSKFESGFFQQGSTWNISRGPLTKSLMKSKSPEEEKEVLAIFNCILRFTGDPMIHGPAEVLFGKNDRTMTMFG